MLEYQNGCNKENEYSKNNIQVLSQSWGVNRIRTATNITTEMSGEQSLAIKASDIANPPMMIVIQNNMTGL